ncbi:unnamed protein product [Sympodiomycopsis kandeliae]
MSTSSLQFGPEWMRKAPSKSSSSASAAGQAASNHPSAGSNKDLKRNPSLGLSSVNGPTPVVSPAAAPSPGAFSFAAAAAGAGGQGAQGSAHSPTISANPYHQQQQQQVAGGAIATGGGPRDHPHQSLSLYSSKEGSRGSSLSPTTPAVPSSAPPDQQNHLHDSADNTSGSHSKRKLFNDRDPSRRSFSTTTANEANSNINAGALSPSLPAEPRGLNARGFSANSGDAPSSAAAARPGLFQRMSSSGGSLKSATAPGSAGAPAPGDSPTTPRERFSGIQGGVLSGVAPPERRRKESEGGIRSSSRHASMASTVPPAVADQHENNLTGSWERRGASSGGTIDHKPSPLDGIATDGAEVNGAEQQNKHAPGSASATTSPWGSRSRRDRAPGEGPIGPPADGSGGFSKFAGYDRKRERTAGHTTDSWRSTSGSHQPVSAAATSAATSDANAIDGKTNDSEPSAAANGRTETNEAQENPDASISEMASALHELSVSGGNAATNGQESMSDNVQASPWSLEDQTWSYRDPSGQVQGPFAAIVMQEWYEQNYFPNHLMVRPDPENDFKALQEYIEASGRNPKLFLSRPPSLQAPPPPSAPANLYQPSPSPLQYQAAQYGFGSPSVAGLKGDTDSPALSHSHLGLGHSTWGDHHTPQQSHSYLDGGLGWPGQQNQHPQHPQAGGPGGAFGGASHMMGVGGPFGNAANGAYGSPFRSHANLPGSGGEMSLDQRLRQQEEYVNMIRQREMDEQARQSAGSRGLSFGQFPSVPGADVFGTPNGADRPWLAKDAWGGSGASNGDAGGVHHQSPWAAANDVNTRQHGDRASRVPWDESIVSSGEHIQPIGTPVRARSPVAVPNAAAAPSSGDVLQTPSKAQNPTEIAATPVAAAIEKAAAGEPQGKQSQDAPESKAADVAAAQPAAAAAAAAAAEVKEAVAQAAPRPLTPQPQDPAPEQDWPQSPSAVEFAAEPDYNQSNNSAADNTPSAASRKSRGTSAVVGSASGKPGADVKTSNAAGNVQVVGAEQFRKGGRGGHATTESTSVATPLSSFLPGSSGPASASTPTSAKAAPWAQQNDDSQQQPAAMSLREIQELEARQAEARRAAERAASAQRRAAGNGVSSPATAAKLPTTMSWGLASIPAGGKVTGSGTSAPSSNGRESPVTTSAPAAWTANKAAPKKTLMEIQEEERKRVAAQQQLKSAQAAAARKAYAESATRQAALPAAAPAPGWSVVGAGGKTTASNGASSATANTNGVSSSSSSAAGARPVARNTASATSIPGVAGAWGSGSATNNAAGSISPALRKASASAVVPSSSSNASVTSSSASSTSPSPEFLRYCKDQLRGLSVKVDDFIEMLLSFPLDPSPDVIEIIAESIYANSSTLDGRRLANDFVQKRKMDAGIHASANGGTGSTGGVISGAGKTASTHGFQQVVKKGGKKRA